MHCITYVLVLLLYWALQLILSFQVPILMPRAVLRTIATIAWDTDQISRSSSLSAPTRPRGVYFAYVFGELWNFWYSFYDTQFLWDTLILTYFGHLRAHMILFLRTLDIVYLLYMMFCSWEQIWKKFYLKVFKSYLPLHNIRFGKLSKEFFNN